MDLFQFKILAAVVIFGMAIIGGMPPVLVGKTERNTRFFFYGESFAKGIFLGAGLLHLLPESRDLYYQLMPHMEYPVMALLCALTIAAMLLLEKAALKMFTSKNNSLAIIPYLVALILSIHSIIAGVTLGLNRTLASFLVVLFAILAHKASGAFALGVSMRNSGVIARKTMFRVMILFSLMTPLGILGGIGLKDILQSHAGILTEAIFYAIAAGTFIYIAVFSADEPEDDEKVSTTLSLLSYSLGLVVMAVVAIWT